jgi:hypothetical protein
MLSVSQSVFHSTNYSNVNEKFKLEKNRSDNVTSFSFSHNVQSSGMHEKALN